MSCSDRLARAAVALAAVALLAATSGCGSDAAADASESTGMAADATTGRIAEVEWARQCTVDTANHAEENAFTADLDARLAAAGFTHEQWRTWHDALADSPELIAQFAEISARGCPAA